MKISPSDVIKIGKKQSSLVPADEIKSEFMIMPLRRKKNKNALNLVIKDIISIKQRGLAFIDIFYNFVCYLTD